MDETLKILAKQLAEEEQRIKDDMAQGRAEEYAQYMHCLRYYPRFSNYSRTHRYVNSKHTGGR